MIPIHRTFRPYPVHEFFQFHSHLYFHLCFGNILNSPPTQLFMISLVSKPLENSTSFPATKWRCIFTPTRRDWLSFLQLSQWISPDSLINPRPTCLLPQLLQDSHWLSLIAMQTLLLQYIISQTSKGPGQWYDLHQPAFSLH
jgi:hypothetical protein